jgi:hypothetical protein
VQVQLVIFCNGGGRDSLRVLCNLYSSDQARYVVSSPTTFEILKTVLKMFSNYVSVHLHALRRYPEFIKKGCT